MLSSSEEELDNGRRDFLFFIPVLTRLMDIELSPCFFFGADFSFGTDFFLDAGFFLSAGFFFGAYFFVNNFDFFFFSDCSFLSFSKIFFSGEDVNIIDFPFLPFLVPFLAPALGKGIMSFGDTYSCGR